MQLAHGTTVAVADGENFLLFRNTGDEVHPKLTALSRPEVGTDNKGSGGRHHSGAANPGENQIDEDSFAAGTAAILNRQVLAGTITHLLVIAAPRTLGELRKHYHAKLSEVLVGEIHKDLTGHPVHDIEKTIAAA